MLLCNVRGRKLNWSSGRREVADALVSDGTLPELFSHVWGICLLCIANTIPMRLSEKAKAYATQKHAETNHFYDGHPYAFHLAMVAEEASKYISDYDQETQEQILAGAWCHDLIEDARETYNDVKKVVGIEVAEIVYAVTNKKGRNRAERADAEYYAGIKANPKATLVKIADRLANVRHSKRGNSRMFGLYKGEFEKFKGALYTPGVFEAAWGDLERIFEGK